MHSLTVILRRRLAVEHEDADVWPFEWEAETTDVAGGVPFTVAEGLAAPATATTDGVEGRGLKVSFTPSKFAHGVADAERSLTDMVHAAMQAAEVL